jgi:hypothetical protein
MKAIVDLAVHTLGPVLYVVLVIGAVAGLVIGVMLLVNSARVMRWNEVLSVWISTGNALAVLDRPVEVKRTVYRWHRLVGVLVLAGSFFTLDALMFGFTTNALVRSFRGSGNSTVLGVAFETVRIFLIVGNIAALLAAAVLVFRPSLLKGVEGWADRSYGGRPGSEKLDAMRYHPDELARAKPKLVGALVLLGSLYALFGLSLLLR